MDTIAIKQERQDLLEIQSAITAAIEVAKSKNSHTCKTLAAILLTINGAINGGGIGELSVFCHQFALKQIDAMTSAIEAQNN